jgi:hypothetical protein
MIHGLLLDLSSRGIVLWVEGTDLHYRAPASVITPEVKALLSEHKTEFVELLADGTRAALESWTTSVNHVADVWDTYAARCLAAGREPVSLDDYVLTARIGAAILVGDVAGTQEAITAWQAAWMAVIGPKVHAAASTATAPSQGIRVRADQILEEVDGRCPPPNPSVHRMFDEARRRFGCRNFEARSITIWLLENAPTVAALWPEAPIEASWLDWRRRVCTDHVVALDAAWKAISGGTKRSVETASGIASGLKTAGIAQGVPGEEATNAYAES